MLTELRGGLCLISAALGLLLPGPALAVQESTPQSIRVTSGAVHHHSTGRSWGRFFAYSSPVDLTGGGFGGNQIYVFSIVDYACQLGRKELERSNDPLNCPDPAQPYLVLATDANPQDGVDNPSVDSSGTVVAFEALGSFEGKCQGGAANRKQVFIRDLSFNPPKTTPVTCNPDGDSYAPSLNDGGGVVAFVSTANLTGGGSGIPQVFVYQYKVADPTDIRLVGTLQGISTTPVAAGTGPSGAPMLNADGQRVAFESRSDLLGDGHDTGVWQIYLFDRSHIFTSQGNGILFQLTHGDADSRDPYVEEKRPGNIWFDSSATDLLGTPTSSTGRQIYRAVINDQPLADPPIEQWTFGPGNSWMPAVEPSGGKVIFLSDGDLLLNGTTGIRLFSIDFRDPVHQVIYQITARGTIGPRIGASLGAWFATFDSDDDVGGYGVCGRQIWIITYDPGHYTEAGHQRLAVSTLGAKPGEPFPGNPNDSCNDADGCTSDVCVGGQLCMHTQEPEGFKCADGDQCTTGVATCQQGKCTVEPPLNCDDSNKCTDDTCDPNTGCTNEPLSCDPKNPCDVGSCDPATGCAAAPLTGMSGVTCQGDQVKGKTPAQGSKQVLKNLKRAQKLLQQAEKKKPKGAKRKLKQAAKLFQDVMPDITTDQSIPREAAAELVIQIRGLLDAISSVLKDIQTKAGGK
jgi:hypothetical protein